jgi:hypothetical protein
VIVTSFKDDLKHSGKVWVVDQEEEEDGFTLIAGLERPVATCWDRNHEFLYVLDTTFGNEGYVY